MRSAKPLASLFLPAFLLLHVSACGDQREPLHIQFGAEWNGDTVACGSSGLSLSDLRFYVSDIVLTDSNGDEQRLELSNDGRWQQSNVALIDLETGADACQNGTPGKHVSLSGLAAGTDFVGLQFTVGVPFSLNHANPLLAEAPLDDSAMHWHWRSGYKFLRAGVRTDNDSAWVHLGSTGCEGSVGNISDCRFPNRIEVKLNDFSPARDSVVVDLSALFDGFDLFDGIGSDCSSSPAEQTCARPFDAVGLAFNGDENRDENTGEQRVFRVQE